jgi:FkbM family methyltransferase
MRQLIKRAVIGTRWEEPIKRAHSALTGSKSSLYDAQTIAIMRRVLRSDSTAVDVGAFEGGMLRHMFRFAPQGRHFAVEPLPNLALRLTQSYPAARVYACALGAERGVVPFHQMIDHPALSGLRQRQEHLPNERSRETQVPMETLDTVIPPDHPIAFLKVDVEGGELGVFHGGAQTLKRNRPVVVFECGVGGADCFGSTPREIFEFLHEAAGLRVSLLGAWLDGRQPLSKESFTAEFEGRLNFYFVAHP